MPNFFPSLVAPRGRARLAALKVAAKLYECPRYPGMASDGPITAWHSYGRFGQDRFTFVHEGRGVDASRAAFALDIER